MIVYQCMYTTLMVALENHIESVGIPAFCSTDFLTHGFIFCGTCFNFDTTALQSTRKTPRALKCSELGLISIFLLFILVLFLGAIFVLFGGVH